MNPKTYIITFEVSPQYLDGLISAIKSYGTWARITSNTWAVTTTGNAISVRNYLRGFITNEDRIFVIKSGYEAAWWNVHSTSDWLKKNL